MYNLDVKKYMTYSEVQRRTNELVVTVATLN